ncbi:DUF6182 family protein [Streptomyces sp. NPDC013953]|uniref:DUF6182 family protein n=1 Tax=Streptomyces sp. NPDC013953 TaxID=3364868 RepID=UPI00370127EA
MTPTQERLRQAAAARIRTARPDLAGRFDLASADGLLAAQAALRAAAQGTGSRPGEGDRDANGGGLAPKTGHIEDTEGTKGVDAAEDTVAAVVIGRLDLARWARSTCAFALSLTGERAALWRRSFTRTVFLAGNPANLRDRFAFAHTADDGSAAWAGPGPASETAALRRLLKLFHGDAALPAAPDLTFRVPGRAGAMDRAPVHRHLYLATAGCSVSEALVHLNHVLAEAVLDGLITHGDAVTIRQVPRLMGVSASFAALRVTAETTLPGRLRAAAGLTEETPLD